MASGQFAVQPQHRILLSPNTRRSENLVELAVANQFLNMELRYPSLNMLRSLMLSMATPCGKKLTKRKLLLSYLSAVLTSTHQIANQVQIFSLLS